LWAVLLSFPLSFSRSMEQGDRLTVILGLEVRGEGRDSSVASLSQNDSQDHRQACYSAVCLRGVPTIIIIADISEENEVQDRKGEKIWRV